MKLKFKLYGRVYNTFDVGDEECVKFAFVPVSGKKRKKNDQYTKMLNLSFQWFVLAHFYKRNQSLEFSYDPSSHWTLAWEFAKAMGARILEFEDEEYDPNVVY